MNFTRLRCWFFSVPITIGVVGVMIEWALYTNHGTTPFYVFVGIIGFFVFVGSIFGGEKLYQKYKDK